MKSIKFLRNVLELFTDNWWLKIFALLLAIVIYYGDRIERTRNQDNGTHDRPLIQFR